MSSKPTNKNAKIPPMETIITRHKSAQLKRQLRKKEQTVKKMTQILRSPTLTKNERASKTVQKTTSPVKPKASPKKSKIVPKVSDKNVKRLRKVSVRLDMEYYPNKLKRTLEAKKVLLKPKHELKMIGSKRKMAVPHKGIESPPPKQIKFESSSQDMCELKSRSPELSVEDMVRLSEESESLNDEDWLEILTCPSPVWWEDPPDAMYIEDAIVTRKPSTPETQNPLETFPEVYSIAICRPSNEPGLAEILNKTVSETHKIKKTDDKYMTKRSKLENLLGNIKNKISNTEKSENCDDVACNNTKTDLNNIETNLDNDKVLKTEDDSIKCNENETMGTSYVQKAYKGIEKANSVSTEGDDPFCTFRDDDLLKDLENMNIPIEQERPDDCVIIDEMTPSCSKHPFLSLDSIKIETVDESKIDKVSDPSNQNVISDFSKKRRTKRTVSKKIKEKKKLHNEIKALKKIYVPIFQNARTSIQKEKSISMDNLVSDANDSLNSRDNLDTISDTNIRFLDDDNTISNSNSLDIASLEKETLINVETINALKSLSKDDNELSTAKTRSILNHEPIAKSNDNSQKLNTESKQTDLSNRETIESLLNEIKCDSSNVLLKSKPNIMRKPKSHLINTRIITKHKLSVPTNTDDSSKPTSQKDALINQTKPISTKLRDKTDIMTVYKIICKDKFPLNNVQKTSKETQDIALENNDQIDDVNVEKEPNQDMKASVENHHHHQPVSVHCWT